MILLHRARCWSITSPSPLRFSAFAVAEKDQPDHRHQDHDRRPHAAQVEAAFGEGFGQRVAARLAERRRADLDDPKSSVTAGTLLGRETVPESAVRGDVVSST